ncbi:YgfZ/GcvT domain-containing protein [Aliikangiella coralliicola]|uniref:Folate-binding protein YgfZ n=1 Tax=Aliikangiella coralliicola TaxID=2592383 RepID=A0A545U6A5_9GAMM|nr:hypothetical protein [Aliikangiella coralliicola]TQV84996.1 hypothetical protein FLL46_21645 [Aliikangiella coralliicola]
MTSHDELIGNQTRLESFGTFEISGVDAARFLQGQITINTDSIVENKLSLAAVCNPQGRCVAVFFATKKPGASTQEAANQDTLSQNESNHDSFWFILPKDNIEATINHFKKYAVFFKTEINDRTDSTNIYGTITDPKNSNDSDNHKLINVTFTEPDSSIIMAVTKNAQAQAQSADQQAKTQLTEQDWLFNVASNGIPWISQASASHFLPHNLNLPTLEAVDFNKGCYTGQEVIARMQYKGKLKSHMQQFRCNVEINITTTDKIYVESQAAAEVICGATNHNGTSTLLALAKDRYLDAKIFRLNDENGPILELVNYH